MNIIKVLVIFIGGVCYALAGFLKNYARGERFDP